MNAQLTLDDIAMDNISESGQFNIDPDDIDIDYGDIDVNASNQDHDMDREMTEELRDDEMYDEIDLNIETDEVLLDADNPHNQAQNEITNQPSPTIEIAHTQLDQESAISSKPNEIHTSDANNSTHELVTELPQPPDESGSKTAETSSEKLTSDNEAQGLDQEKDVQEAVASPRQETVTNDNVESSATATSEKTQIPDQSDENEPEDKADTSHDLNNEEPESIRDFPVILCCPGGEYKMFPDPWEEVQTASCFFQDKSIISQPLRHLIRAIRNQLAEGCDDNIEFTLSVPTLGLTISELDPHAVEGGCTLEEFLDLYITLSYNDDNLEPAPLKIVLRLAEKFYGRYRFLRQAAIDGKGLTQAKPFYHHNLELTEHTSPVRTPSNDDEAHEAYSARRDSHATAKPVAVDDIHGHAVGESEPGIAFLEPHQVEDGTKSQLQVETDLSLKGQIDAVEEVTDPANEDDGEDDLIDWAEDEEEPPLAEGVTIEQSDSTAAPNSSTAVEVKEGHVNADLSGRASARKLDEEAEGQETATQTFAEGETSNNVSNPSANFVSDDHQNNREFRDLGTASSLQSQEKYDNLETDPNVYDDDEADEEELDVHANAEPEDDAEAIVDAEQGVDYDASLEADATLDAEAEADDEEYLEGDVDEENLEITADDLENHSEPSPEAEGGVKLDVAAPEPAHSLGADLAPPKASTPRKSPKLSSKRTLDDFEDDLIDYSDSDIDTPSKRVKTTATV